MLATSINVSSRTLEETPARAIPFLRALATNVNIRAIMMSAGYTDADQSRGWELVFTASGYARPEPSVTDDQVARDAIAEVDNTEEPLFRRTRAAFDRLHPEQSAFVFNGLETTTGPAAIVTMTTYLDRIDALESSPERAATREADHAALQTLEQRGIGKAERARLRHLLGVARGIVAPVTLPVAPSTEDRDQALRELRAWYVDWAETARAVIRRRDHLILMGLAHRKPRGAGAEDEADTVDEPPDSVPSLAIAVQA
jgi:hypothetical protein